MALGAMLRSKIEQIMMTLILKNLTDDDNNHGNQSDEVEEDGPGFT